MAMEVSSNLGTIGIGDPHGSPMTIGITDREEKESNMSEEQMRVFVVLNSPIDPQVDEETSLEGIFRNIDDAKKHILSEIALCIKNGRNLEYTLDDEVDLNGPAGLIGSVATYEVSEDGEPKYNYWISQKIVQ